MIASGTAGGFFTEDFLLRLISSGADGASDPGEIFSLEGSDRTGGSGSTDGHAGLPGADAEGGEGGLNDFRSDSAVFVGFIGGGEVNTGGVDQTIAKECEALAAGAIDGDEADAGEIPGHLGEESGGGIAGGDDEGATGEVVEDGVGMGR